MLKVPRQGMGNMEWETNCRYSKKITAENAKDAEEIQRSRCPQRFIKVGGGFVSRLPAPKRSFSTLLTIMILILFSLSLMSSINVTAQGSGLHTVGGYVYDSDDHVVNTTYDGAYAAIILEHGTTNYTYIDHDGITNGWYVITLPDGAWDEGDRYWVVVDGTSWGDVNFTCHGQGQPDVYWWRLAGGGAEHRNVVTLSEIPQDLKAEEDEEDNLKPLLALAIIIILCIHGLLIAYKRPLNLTEPKAWVVDGEFREIIAVKNMQPTAPTSDPDPQVAKGQPGNAPQPAAQTSTNVPQQPTAEVKPYTEALTVAQAQQKADEKVEAQFKDIDDKVTKLDGKIELNKLKLLQVQKSEKLKKDRIYTFIVLAKPCIVLEIIIAVLSLSFDFLQVPPLDGPGFFINIIILIIGVLIGLAGFKKGYRLLENVESQKSKI
jgi:hypothetical protein